MPSLGRTNVSVVGDENTPCRACEFNDKGYCLEHNKWGYLVHRCIEKGNKPDKVKLSNTISYSRVSGYQCIRKEKRTDKYNVRFNENSTEYNLGLFDSLQAAVNALAKKEIELLGKRKRNLHHDVL